jgi:aryl-alcohol dehydrogenase-like predicted oxidoreductase
MGMSNLYGPRDDESNIDTLCRAYELGVTFFDTAEVYGPRHHNELLLGRVFGGSFHELVVATKIGMSVDEASGRTRIENGRPVVDGSPGNLRRAAMSSRRRLHRDRIDLVYLHRIDSRVPIEDSVGALAELVEEGVIGAIGLSEASADTIRRAHAIHPIAAVQTEYSIFERGVERNGVLDVTSELGIAFIPYAPLGRGLLTGRVRQDFDFSDFRRTDPRMSGSNLEANLVVVEAIQRIAKARGNSAAQLAVAWTLAKGGVPIPGASRRRHLEENVAAADVKLSSTEIASLDSLEQLKAGARYATNLLAGLTI